MRNFEQDTLFISIELEKYQKDDFVDQVYFPSKNNSNIDFNIDLNDNLAQKCLLNYGLTPRDIMIYKNVNDSDNDLLTTIKFICYNITFEQMMDKINFYNNYLRDEIDIPLNQFINSSQYSIGYFISQKLEEDTSPFKSVVTYIFNNVSYDQDNILVSFFSN